MGVKKNNAIGKKTLTFNDCYSISAEHLQLW